MKNTIENLQLQTWSIEVQILKMQTISKIRQENWRKKLDYH